MNSWMSLVMNEWMNLNDKLQEVIPDCRSMQACSNHLQTLHEFLQVSTKPSEFVSKPGSSSKWKLTRRKLTGDANRNRRSQLVKHSPASSLSNVSCKLDLLGQGISSKSHELPTKTETKTIWLFWTCPLYPKENRVRLCLCSHPPAANKEGI